METHLQIERSIPVGIIWKFQSVFSLSSNTEGAGRDLTLEILYLSVLRDIEVLITKQSLQNTHTSSGVIDAAVVLICTICTGFALQIKSRSPGTGKKTDFAQR